MTGRQIRRMLYGLLCLALFAIVLHSGRTAYLLATEGHDAMRLRTGFQADYSNQQYLDSLLDSTSLNELKQISKLELPWYFKDGTLKPRRALINSKTGHRTSQIWPKELKNGDRVEEQLMFVPPHYQYDDEPMKKILLFNGLSNWIVEEGQGVFITKSCPVNRCEITVKKSEAQHADAILFRDHFSHPGHRKSGRQVWILYFLESPYHTELITYNDVFNWTATYRHDSDIVTPYERWAYYDPLITQKDQLDRNYAFNKTKQVAWFVSNCGAKNGRLHYARELSKYISVDVYGVCGKLKCPRSGKCFQMLDEHYKFYLAFENSNCADYITEKFFVNGLQHNVLPIVMGARREDYDRIAPKHSYVHVDDYESPKALAEYLHRLDSDDSLYNEYFRWKGTGEFIDTKFFCRLCAVLHDNYPAKHYRNINEWWRGPGVCNNAMPWRRFLEPDEDID
ncbi:glycoprotein 3-alpha-L-fucosyltransferase A-like isoform X1 [Daktulosphaira vitifoliae]|uniref:glycoprotein 3-alpha-L-fucosyltransferase A-like isoform X1 n=1 Tax=Daktulosphaira vitifoliae TaxID=58002 RepID=UPI0021AA6F56|nr:glycoprotein 3-alpha-L-fucosyltransferase A-like isoform X1 [Daktulosphaira vitifoliae]XP_050535703.1 glycoprotein 3-alpha-L-fucosyltransferase A-like isoform X1 [Daktulosphaira vitifoliae]